MRKIIIYINFWICFLNCPVVLSQTIAIRAGHIVDPASGTVTDNQIILIKDGKIVDIRAKIQTSDADQVVDLQNSWLIPGLMDAHTHLTLSIPPNLPSGLPFEFTYLKESSALRALRCLRHARLVLETGFTTVRDVGNEANFAATDVRRAIEMGWFDGPTILNAGKIIGPFGGQSYRMSPEQGMFWLFEYIDADTPDEVRKAVRQNIYYGANIIKLVADNSVFYYSEEEIRAAVEEAHKVGLTVAIHVMGGEAAKNAILGGVDSIEHGFELSDDLLKLMKEKGVVLVGTDLPLAHVKQMDYFFLGNAEARAKRIVDRLKRAHKIGVKMAFGTDAVVDLPGKNRAEMAFDYLAVWEEAGIPPQKILKCMTTNAAELLKIQNERGAIAAGQWADIIATPELSESEREIENESIL